MNVLLDTLHGHTNLCSCRCYTLRSKYIMMMMLLLLLLNLVQDVKAANDVVTNKTTRPAYYVGIVECPSSIRPSNESKPLFGYTMWEDIVYDINAATSIESSNDNTVLSIILCPNQYYDASYSDPMIVQRSNVHFKCGDDVTTIDNDNTSSTNDSSSSSNSCIVDGSNITVGLNLANIVFQNIQWKYQRDEFIIGSNSHVTISNCQFHDTLLGKHKSTIVSYGTTTIHDTILMNNYGRTVLHVVTGMTYIHNVQFRHNMAADPELPESIDNTASQLQASSSSTNRNKKFSTTASAIVVGNSTDPLMIMTPQTTTNSRATISIIDSCFEGNSGSSNTVVIHVNSNISQNRGNAILVSPLNNVEEDPTTTTRKQKVCDGITILQSTTDSSTNNTTNVAVKCQKFQYTNTSCSDAFTIHNIDSDNQNDEGTLVDEDSSSTDDADDDNQFVVVDPTFNDKDDDNDSNILDVEVPDDDSIDFGTGSGSFAVAVTAVATHITWIIAIAVTYLYW